jgi:ferritin-like metal-binding protein YciE
MASLGAQLDVYLRDAHAIEQQALPRLRAAPDLAVDVALATAFRQHLMETEHHEQLIRDRLEARGVAPARLKHAAFKADTPAKLVSHALAYEHLELAGYELLRRLARLAGDHTTIVVAAAIREDERAMAERLEACFDRTVEASLRVADRANLDEQLNKDLADALAIEGLGIELLEHGPRLAGDPELAHVYEEHLDESREQERLVGERLEARGGSASQLEDAAIELAPQPDTPAKLAAFAYAFEFLQVGGYEQLARVARRAADGETERLSREIIATERDMADRVWQRLDAALEASLGVAPEATVA